MALLKKTEIKKYQSLKNTIFISTYINILKLKQEDTFSDVLIFPVNSFSKLEKILKLFQIKILKTNNLVKYDKK